VTKRAIERRVLRLVEEGQDEAEIARRFRRTPETIARIIVMANLPRSDRPVEPAVARRLRPLERRVLRWRDGGADAAEIGARFRRSAAHISRVEGFARSKLERWSPPERGG
jgi:DNA-binding CsgD family transcriptional regulator